MEGTKAQSGYSSRRSRVLFQFYSVAKSLCDLLCLYLSKLKIKDVPCPLMLCNKTSALPFSGSMVKVFQQLGKCGGIPSLDMARRLNRSKGMKRGKGHMYRKIYFYYKTILQTVFLFSGLLFSIC